MKLTLKVLGVIAGVLFVARLGFCQQCPPEKVVFGFEGDIGGWEIPDWCFEKEEYVAQGITVSDKVAGEGKSSLEIMTNFPGGKWTAAYIEVPQYFDWTPYKSLSVDVYLPADAPFGLQGRVILTVGADWAWIEMARLVKLAPGEWTTITANLGPGSTDWRRTQVTDKFRSDIRKLGVRIESNLRPVYKGPVYVDNIRLSN
ncbi:MAG: hypothetical protein FJZ13_01710 [Candidatus Omnitrophica bacterium]|nr:hypothetical protein [Candidatus Omnitrophota bacterium]